MNWLIYSFGNGNMLFDVFTSIALMVGAGYESLIRLAMLGLGFGALTYVISRGHVPWHLLCGAIMLLAVTVQIRATVTIQDLVNPGVPTRTVGNIPLAVAFPAYVASEASFQLLTLVETAFALTVPPEYQVINASMGKGFFDFQKLLGAQLPDGDLQRNVTEYLKQCVIPAMNRGELTTTAVFHAPDMLAAINVAGGLDVLRLYVGGVRGPTATCTDTYTNFVLPGMAPGGDASYDLAMKQLRQSLGVQDLPLAEEGPVTTAMTRMLGTGQSARAAINNVLIRERWHNAEDLIRQSGNDSAGAVSALGKQLGEDLKSQAFADSIMNARFLPLLRTMAESGVYLLTPFALVLAFTPSMFGTIRSTVMAYAWLLLWAPLYAVVNYLVYAYGTTQLTSLVDPGVGITYANYVDFYDILNQLNSFSSKIAWGVPTMAAALAYGLGSAVSSLSQGGQGFQAAAGHEASAMAHGQFRHVDPNRHLEYEQDTRLDAAGHEYHEPVLRSASGMMSVHQTGTREIAFADGSHTTIGTTGTMTHQGPTGYYSQDKDGHYLSGVWREEVQDEASGHTMSMQREVLGAEIRSRGSYMGSHGVQHHVEQVENQYDHGQSYREESWTANGFSHTETTMGDGSRLHKEDGFGVTAPIGPDDHVMGAPRPFRIQSTFFQPAPTEGNPDPAWEHQNTELTGGTDGQEHYSATIDGAGASPEDHSHAFHVTGGTHNKTVGEKSTYEGLRVAHDQGSEGHVGSVDGSVKMAILDKNGHRMVAQAVLTGDHIPLDAEGHPVDGFNATAVTNDHGKYGVHQGTATYNPEAQMWEMQETDAQYHSRLGGQSSGAKLMVNGADGKGRYQLDRGNIRHDGNPNDPGHAWHYDGQIRDLQTGEVFDGKMDFDGQHLYTSSMATGDKRQMVDSDGTQIQISGDPHAPDGAQYTKTGPTSGWVPTSIDSDGRKLYSHLSGQWTESGVVRGSGEPGTQEALTYLPNEARFSATTPEGAVTMQALKTSVPGSSIHRVGNLGTQISASGQDGSIASDHSQAATAVPVGGHEPVPVLLPVDGRIGRQLVLSQTHKEADGTLTAETLTRDPFTMALAHSHREGGVQVSVNNRRVDAKPITIDHMDGVDGPVTAYAERVSDPSRPDKTVSGTLLKDTNGDMFVTRMGQPGRLTMKMGESGKWVGKFEALREDHVQGHTKFAVTQVSNTDGAVLHQHGLSGENFVSQYNNREEHLAGTSLDAMGLIRDAYEKLGGEITPGDDKYFRSVAYGLETGAMTAETAQKFLSLRFSIQRARGPRKPAGAGKATGQQNAEEDLAREMMRRGFQDMK